MVRTSGTMGHEITGSGSCPQNRLRFFLPAPSSAPVNGSALGSDFVRADIALTSVACSVESVTLALPSPPSTAGWGLNVVEMLIAVPASADLATFRHIVVLVGEFLDWRQFPRREIIANRLKRLLEGSWCAASRVIRNASASFTPIVCHVDQTLIDDFARASAATFERRSAVGSPMVST